MSAGSVIGHSRCVTASVPVADRTGVCVTAMRSTTADVASAPECMSRIGSTLACAARISSSLSATGPGITSSCGSTTRSAGSRRARAPMSPRWVTCPSDRLLVHVQRGSRVGDERPVLGPCPQRPRGVLVPALRAGLLLAREDEADDVVRVRGLQGDDGVAVEDVVRRAGHRGQAAHAIRRVAEPSQRVEHEPSWGRRVHLAHASHRTVRRSRGRRVPRWVRQHAGGRGE